MGSNDELESFIKIAQGTLCEGLDKQAICSHNAEVRPAVLCLAVPSLKASS